MPPKTTALRVLHVGFCLVVVLVMAACGSTATTTIRSDPPAHRQNVHTEREQQHREAVALAQTWRAEEAARQQEREAEEPLERWRALQHDLVGALVLQGGAETYERISGEAESKGRAYAASEIKTLVGSLSTTRAELARIAEHSQDACAAAIQNARTLLKERQSIVQQTRIDSMGSEYGWANTAHELEPLELPEGHLGDGLEACDPSGTGEIEEEAQTAAEG
jgi:hypothetical protein